MDTTIRVLPDSRYQPYMRLIVLFTSVVIIAPVAIPIIFIPDVIGQIVLGCVAVVELFIIILIDRWIPYYVRSLEYHITGETVEFRGGVFWKRHVTVPYVKITNVDVTQGPVERKFGIGTVHVQTAGAGGAQGARAELRVSGVTDFDRIRELILSRIGAGRCKDDGSGSGVVNPNTGKYGEQDMLLSAILAELKAIRLELSGGR